MRNSFIYLTYSQVHTQIHEIYYSTLQIPFSDGFGKVACHITGDVGGWYNQVKWMMLPGVFVGKVVILR